MKKTIQYKGIPLVYNVSGDGEVLVFLHGYLETSEIWMRFAARFIKNFKVICPDIPGHGQSGVLGEVHEMDEMAGAIKAILDAEGVHKIILIGHSMGGYVTMSFARLFPEMLRGYTLFHSTCFADNEEKKKNRDREISLVKCGKKLQILRTNIPRAFADDNIESMADDVIHAKEVAENCSDEGVIALLNGMKNRTDHSEVFSQKEPPSLIVWGKKDNYIGEEAFNKLLSLEPSSVLVLNNSGHMGFVEEPNCAYNGLMNFFGQL